MRDNSELRPQFLNIGLKVQNLSLRLIHDNYNFDQRDVYYQVAPQAIKTVFSGYYFEVKYDYNLKENIVVTPKLKYKGQLPWSCSSGAAKNIAEQDPDAYGAVYLKKFVERYLKDYLVSYFQKNDQIG